MELETGTDDTIGIECSEQTRKEFLRVKADIDPTMTHEELIHAVIRLHDNYPGQLKKHHY